MQAAVMERPNEESVDAEKSAGEFAEEISPEAESKDAPREEQSKRKKGERNKALGRKGEQAAAKFLYNRGYDILETNWTCFAGEADIIAKDGDCLVFVEVKTRRDCQKGFPAEAVNAKKRAKYEKIALAYLSEYRESEISVRFDIISIVVVAENRALIRHHINAFSGE